MQPLTLRFPNEKLKSLLLCREAESRRELKHLSTGRKRKQIVMPLLAESEKGTGRAESAFEKKLEMW